MAPPGAAAPASVPLTQSDPSSPPTLDPPTLDPAFLEAAVKLAGTAELPGPFASAAHDALVAAHGNQTVDALVHAVADWDGTSALPADVEPAAQRLLLILYTGDVRAEADPARGAAPFSRSALAWQTLGFAHPPGICGGVFGAWTRPG